MFKNICYTLTMIFVISLLSLQACVAPFSFTIRDDRYDSEQPSLIIVPVYTDIEQLQFIQNTMPLFQDFDIDSAYTQYEYLYDKFDSTEKERRNVFYLVISTRF